MQKRRGKNIVKTRIIVIVLLAAAYFLLQLIEDHPHAIERYYSEGIYLFICKILHSVFNLFPFSVGDILYLVAIGFIIYYFVKLVKLLFKKQFKQAGILALGMVMSVQIAMLGFYILWGLNYFRPSAGERLKLADSDYTTEQLVVLTRIAIDSANITRTRVTNADLQQTNSTIKQTAIAAIKSLAATSPNFATYSPDIKLSLFTPVINYLGTSGYYNPYTSESQINYQMPVFLRPFVACHEMSHQMGYGAEDEANYVGFLAGLQSRDHLLRYSAFHELVDECMGDLRDRDSLVQQKMKKLVSPAVHRDFVIEHNYWVSHESAVNTVSSFFYNDFLKANNQPHGLQTYNRMVRLVMSYYNRQKLRPLTPRN